MPHTIILWLSNFSALFAVWIGRKEKSVIWLYAFSSLVFDINGFVLKAFDIERLWASNLFLLVEFVLLSLFFMPLVFPTRYHKNSKWIIALVAIYFVIHTFMLSVWKPNYVDASVLYLFYIFYCICGLYKVIRDIEFVLVERNPLFIFCIAILLYASGSLIILLFENDLLHTQKEFIYALWKLIRNPLNIIKNLLIAYGFVLIKRNKAGALVASVVRKHG